MCDYVTEISNSYKIELILFIAIAIFCAICVWLYAENFDRFVFYVDKISKIIYI